MLEREKYKLSTYQTVEILRSKEDSVVELVESTLDGKKYIKKTYREDKRTIYRLLAEIECDSLAKVHEVFFGEDTIVIEQYVAGKTLWQLIIEKHIFSKEELRKIVDSLTEGIASLHHKNIIHRDIKPSNIIITSDGKAVLIDYGIARIHTAEKADDTEYFGTAGFAAPEQFGFRQSDFRTDIYALGMTLQQIVTSRNASQAMMKAINKCAEFAPDRRFRTIDELREHLKRAEMRRQNILRICAVIIICALAGVWLWSMERTPLQETAVTVETAEQTQKMKKKQPETVTKTSTRTEKKPADMDRQAIETVKRDISDKLGTHSELVGLMHSRGEARCWPMKADRQAVSVDLGNGRPTYISAERSGSTLRVTIDRKTTFTFADDKRLPRANYPQGSMIAELIFYDMNRDGILDIIPIISNGIRTKWGDGSIVVQKNYSLGWCIYLQGETYIRAENRMAALIDTFKIDANAPGCIWTDFPAHYTLKGGKLILHQ